MSRVSLPVPSHFTYAEQPFSLKKKRLPLSSSSTSNVSTSSPVQLSGSLPPLLPSKGCPPLSRVFPQHQSPWTPLSCSLSVSPPSDSVYDPSKQETYFNQCFTILGLLGRGCFGEVYKVSTQQQQQKKVQPMLVRKHVLCITPGAKQQRWPPVCRKALCPPLQGQQ